MQFKAFRCIGQEGFQLGRSLREPASIVFRDRGLELAIEFLIWSIAGSGKVARNRQEPRTASRYEGFPLTVISWYHRIN